MLYVGATKDMQRTPMVINTTECNMKYNYATEGNSSSAFQNAQDQYIIKCADIYIYISLNVQINISSNVQINISSNVQINISLNVQFNISSNVQINISLSVQINISSNVQRTVSEHGSHIGSSFLNLLTNFTCTNCVL